MTNNLTERQMLLIISILRNRYVFGLVNVLAVVVMLFLGSCGSKPKVQAKAEYSTADALSDYALYVERISAKKNVDTKDFISLVQEWKELDDTIANRLLIGADTENVANADSVYVNLREKIVDGFANMVDARQRSLNDYLEVLVALTKPSPDSLVTSMHRFYGSMDGTKTYGLGSAATIVRYEQMLSETIAKGLHTKQDVFAFLRDEDRSFRSFLEHLSTLGDVPLLKVRDNTSALLKQIVEQAADKDGVFAPHEVVTIITMRNVRRLMQNALQCVNDINAGKVGDTDQAAAYMWMLLQPWVSFDAYAFTTMSEAQFKTMRILATQTPKCIVKLGNPGFPVSIDELPALLIKTYITTL